MYIALSLVGLTFLAAQCHSRAISENDRQYSVETVFYQPIGYRNTRQERPLQQVSRASEQYQYQYETNSQLESHYQPSYSGKLENQPTSRTRQGKQLPTIEQYLKEVTPTTKTVYDPRKYNNAEKEKLGQYNYQAQFEQQPLYQRTEEAHKGAPVAQNILAYENARIAQQIAIYEQQRADQLIKQQKAALYAPEDNQKYLPIQTVTKPKTSTLDEEISYYTKLQYEQQQLKQQNKAFEVKQPAPAKYQARIPQNSKPELLSAEEEHTFLYEPEPQYNAPSQIIKPTTQPEEQRFQSDRQYQQKLIYGPIPENGEIKYYGQPQQIQYQLQPVGGRYVTDGKQVRYQEQPVKPAQQNDNPALQKYRLNIKYQSVQSNKPTNPVQVQPQYIPEEQSQGVQRYQPQQYSDSAKVQPQQYPAYLGPTDEEYKQSQFKQSLGRNSSLRVLKTGKPVVFVGHEE